MKPSKREIEEYRVDHEEHDPDSPYFRPTTPKWSIPIEPSEDDSGKMDN